MSLSSRARKGRRRALEGERARMRERVDGVPMTRADRRTATPGGLARARAAGPAALGAIAGAWTRAHGAADRAVFAVERDGLIDAMLVTGALAREIAAKLGEPFDASRAKDGALLVA